MRIRCRPRSQCRIDLPCTGETHSCRDGEPVRSRCPCSHRHRCSGSSSTDRTTEVSSDPSDPDLFLFSFRAADLFPSSFHACGLCASASVSAFYVVVDVVVLFVFVFSDLAVSFPFFSVVFSGVDAVTSSTGFYVVSFVACLFSVGGGAVFAFSELSFRGVGVCASALPHAGREGEGE